MSEERVVPESGWEKKSDSGPPRPIQRPEQATPPPKKEK